MLSLPIWYLLFCFGYFCQEFNVVEECNQWKLSPPGGHHNWSQTAGAWLVIVQWYRSTPYALVKNENGRKHAEKTIWANGKNNLTLTISALLLFFLISMNLAKISIVGASFLARASLLGTAIQEKKSRNVVKYLRYHFSKNPTSTSTYFRAHFYLQVVKREPKDIHTLPYSKT